MSPARYLEPVPLDRVVSGRSAQSRHSLRALQDDLDRLQAEADQLAGALDGYLDRLITRGAR